MSVLRASLRVHNYGAGNCDVQDYAGSSGFRFNDDRGESEGSVDGFWREDCEGRDLTGSVWIEGSQDYGYL